MPPNVSTVPITENFQNRLPPREYKILWLSLLMYTLLHVSAIYGFYLVVCKAKWLSCLWVVLLYQLGTIGVTAGAHRLWSHRAFKVKTPLKIILLLFETISFEDSAINWSKNHRIHHKYTETDADPYCAKRGLFFSHIGWLLCHPHADVKEKRKQVDISDLTGDPLVAFQHKHYLKLASLFCFFLPTVFPMWMWNETLWNAWYINLFRCALTMNSTWLVNSAAHFYGTRPYDKTIYAAENVGASIMTLGEGWHNYHHAFPWDYKGSELGKYGSNITTSFIDLMAKIGWAYDLKSVSPETVKNRVRRTGDGSHEIWGCNLKEEDAKEAVVTCKRE